MGMKLRIHIGAHKTATTHLQQTLLEHREVLKDRGVDYLPREIFRPLAHDYSRPRSWKARAWPLLKGRFHRQLTGLLSGPDRVLISDEDLLGYSYDLLRVPLYPDFKAMHLVRYLADRYDTELFLGIRSFDGILPSAYAQTLKAVPQTPGTMDRICDNIQHAPPSWAELVDRIRAAVPNAGLHVWRQEDYRTHWRDCLDLYAGQPLGALAELPPPERTQSPSPEAVAEAERMDPAIPRRDRITRVKALYAEKPAGDLHGRYKPLDEATIALLKARYNKDLADIDERHPGTLLTFGTA